MSESTSSRAKSASLFADADPPDRWNGIVRTWHPTDVLRLRPSLPVRHTLAEAGAERMWALLRGNAPVTALGAVTGNQAVQQVRAGLAAVYVSGWQVAADANLSGQTYPDQGLYPSNSVPALVRRINAALQRADQVEHAEGLDGRAWMAPIVADAEAGFGGPLHAFELTRQLIEAGAAAVHFEDQLAAEKKCGHMGGKVLVPTQHFIDTLSAARLAADVCGVRTLIIARTDAEAATLLTSDVDPRDRPFLTGERTVEGHYRVRPGLEAAIARALAFAPYADILWCETSTPDLAAARRFAEAIHARFPGKLLAYNCSPSFNWKRHLDERAIATFQKDLAGLGYRFQFVTLAGFHSLNHAMYTLARDFASRGMSAYADLQAAELAAETKGYTAARHQREVGTGWYDAVATLLSHDGAPSTLALEGSTERGQFGTPRKVDGRSREGRALRAAQGVRSVETPASDPSPSSRKRTRPAPAEAAPPVRVDGRTREGRALRAAREAAAARPGVPTRIDGRTREGRALRAAQEVEAAESAVPRTRRGAEARPAPARGRRSAKRT